jgi:hypothetical protein
MAKRFIVENRSNNSSNLLGSIPTPIMKSQILPLLDYPGMTGLFQSNKTYYNKLQPNLNNKSRDILDTKINKHFQEQKFVSQFVSQLQNFNSILDNYRNIYSKFDKFFDSINSFIPLPISVPTSASTSTSTKSNVDQNQNQHYLHFSTQFYEELFRVYQSLSQIRNSINFNYDVDDAAGDEVQDQDRYMEEIFKILQYDPLSHVHTLLKFYQYIFGLTADFDEGQYKIIKDEYQSIFNNINLIIDKGNDSLKIEDFKILLDLSFPLITYNNGNVKNIAEIFEWSVHINGIWIRDYLYRKIDFNEFWKIIIKQFSFIYRPFVPESFSDLNYKINLFVMILKNFQLLPSLPDEDSNPDFSTLKENLNNLILKINWTSLINKLNSGQVAHEYRSFWIDFILCALISIENMKEAFIATDSVMVMNLLQNDIDFQLYFETGQSIFSKSFQNNYLNFIWWLDLYFNWKYYPQSYSTIIITDSENISKMNKLRDILNFNRRPLIFNFSSFNSNITMSDIIFNITKQMLPIF